MRERRWSAWLHRIGYVTTAIVAAELVAVIGVVGYERYWRHQQQAEYRRSTAYGDAPSSEAKSLKRDFALLPAAASLGPDGLRFVARPELDRRSYAVALRNVPGRSAAEGVLIVREELPERKPTISSYKLRLPAEDYGRLVRGIDRRLDGFAGLTEGGLGTDGTSLAFQRVRGARISEGGANMEEPYRSLGEDVLLALRPAHPDLPLPPSGRDWYRPDNRRLP